MNTVEEKTISITIGIQDLKLIHFETTTRLSELKTPLPQEVFEFQFQVQSRLLQLDKLYEVYFSTTLFEKQGILTKLELASIKTLTSFRIVNFDEVVQKNQNQVSIPDRLITLTAGTIIINNITESDLKSRILRITVENKRIFPTEKTGYPTIYHLDFSAGSLDFVAEYKIGSKDGKSRSGILKLRDSIYQETLKIKEGTGLKISKSIDNKYRIERM